MLNRLVTGLSYGTLSGAGYAAGAAACSAAGAGILAAAHHASYHAAPQAASGAVGGAILGGGLALVAGLVAPDAVAAKFSGKAVSSRVPPVVELAAGAASIVISGIVGAAVLRDAGHLNIPSTSHAAAASAVGTAVISGGAFVIGLLLYKPTRSLVSEV